MIFGKNTKGEKVGLRALSYDDVVKRPIEQLGTLLKSASIEAETQGASSLYIYVSIEGDQGVPHGGTPAD